MKIRIPFIVFLSLIVFRTSFAQEVVYPLSVNPALVIESMKEKNMMQRRVVIDDTLDLPFVDDFSRPGMFPFDSLWLDSGVYINNNYTPRPVTIGIATFDGLNKDGQPYQPTSSIDSVADILTSRPLDLTVPSGDTSVWLFFFYQPQGLGDPPETGDSLVLQFKDTSGVWNNIWAVDGRGDTVWQRVNIRVSDEKYLFRGFQLRFYNIATVNGNRDQWNLDYVSLNKNTSENALIADNAMIHPQISMLSEFSAMPYSHYKAVGQAAMKTAFDDTLYNIDYGPTSYVVAGEILQNGTQIWTNNLFTSATSDSVYIPYSISLNNFSFPIQNTDSASFLFKSYFSQPGFETNSFNDTSYLNQNFYNYYSYDDGSVELSYGLTGNLDVEVAYQFNVKIQDTLRGVQIYFDPTGLNVANTLFQLAVWTDVNLTNNTSVLLYKLINQRPGGFNGINGYKTYLFDTTLIVGPGNIWVGFIQNEPQTLYGLGLDRNVDSHSKMLYHVDGNWFQSGIKGSWMMRPLFGKYIPLVSVEEVSTYAPNFSVFPNPTSNSFRLQFENKEGRMYQYRIFDCIGSLVAEANISSSNDIDVSKLSKGIYFIRLSEKGNNSLPSVQKLVIQ